ncbi:MAG: endonuclease NucS [Candidatus Bathyarchaeia archaeon]
MSIEKIKVESHQELEQMLTNELNQIEKGLTVICSDIQISDKTTLDILCHDNNGQLVIIQLDVEEDDIMLLRGIQSLDYVDKFKSFLKATYNKHKINDAEKPRLILVAPSFSDAVRRAVESMKGIRIDLYEWEYLKLGDHKGLRLQPIFTWEQVEKSKEEKLPEKKREPKKKEPEIVPVEKKETKPEPPKPEPKPEPSKPPIMFPLPPAEKPKEKVEPAKEEPKKKLKLF